MTARCIPGCTSVWRLQICVCVQLFLSLLCEGMRRRQLPAWDPVTLLAASPASQASGESGRREGGNQSLLHRSEFSSTGLKDLIPDHRSFHASHDAQEASVTSGSPAHGVCLTSELTAAQQQQGSHMKPPQDSLFTVQLCAPMTTSTVSQNQTETETSTGARQKTPRVSEKTTSETWRRWRV